VAGSIPVISTTTIIGYTISGGGEVTILNSAVTDNAWAKAARRHKFGPDMVRGAAPQTVQHGLARRYCSGLPSFRRAFARRWQ
jgi:hypothetical protein